MDVLYVLLFIVSLSTCGADVRRCTDATTGGSAQGADCVFPFIYRGEFYDDCITHRNNDQPWCATVTNYDKQRKWGNCITDCDTPSCPVPTTGGNGNGANCVFPFRFENEVYFNCYSGTGDTLGPWCSVTGNWSSDHLWGTCMIYTTRDDQLCVFPFVYNGTIYYDCTTDGSSEDLLWCGVTTLVTGSPEDWGYCMLDGHCEDEEATTTIEPEEQTTEVLDSRCVSSCEGRWDWDYQSCLGCSVYASCVAGNLIDNRPCPGGLVWDDNSKQCLWSSSTCP